MARRRSVGCRSLSAFESIPLETLEARCLLTGNVTAKVVHGDLVIRGDSESNSIKIEYTGNPGEYKITGIGTTVNGLANVTLPGVTDDMTIKMGNGDDQVLLLSNGTKHFSIPDQLTVSLGSGINSLVLDTDDTAQILVGGDVSVKS